MFYSSLRAATLLSNDNFYVYTRVWDNYNIIIFKDSGVIKSNVCKLNMIKNNAARIVKNVSQKRDWFRLVSRTVKIFWPLSISSLPWTILILFSVLFVQWSIFPPFHVKL